MPDSNEELALQNAALTRQFLEWIAATPRTYADALDTWRSSCPRHTIWEDAMAAGLVDCAGTQEARLCLTERGWAMLGQRTAAATESPAR